MALALIKFNLTSIGVSLVSPAIVLSIAGSDCGGGAGIQADIKSIAANGGYAVTVITAITAQNTQGVRSITPTSLKSVEDQLISVFEDFKIDSVKIGMLNNSKTVELVADILKEYKPGFVVLDPVMTSSSGEVLTEQDAVSTMIEKLFPCCSLITPNLDETYSITSSYLPQFRFDKFQLFEEIKQHALQIFNLGVENVLITGVLSKELNYFRDNYDKTTKHNIFDLLLSKKEFSIFGKQKIESRNTHGTGCSLSSSIATNIALGEDLINSITLSQEYVYGCILSAKNINIGNGMGPINHFFSSQLLKNIN